MAKNMLEQVGVGKGLADIFQAIHVKDHWEYQRKGHVQKLPGYSTRLRRNTGAEAMPPKPRWL